LILLKDARRLWAQLAGVMKRTWLLLGLSVLLVGGFYLLLLACPLLHLFHGHGGHGGHHSGSEERRE
jgi:hypothetical protein